MKLPLIKERDISESYSDSSQGHWRGKCSNHVAEDSKYAIAETTVGQSRRNGVKFVYLILSLNSYFKWPLSDCIFGRSSISFYFKWTSRLLFSSYKKQ